MNTKNQILIAAGSAYVDIDVLASSVALQEWLQAQGVKASICYTGLLNATTPTSLATRVESFIRKHPPLVQEGTSFILVDVSDPNHFEKFVEQSNITKIFDHHILQFLPHLPQA
jgi:nanoRNase/pAp phosphatase (c-di-AMP/oligoRNAs hydrolase)